VAVLFEADLNSARAFSGRPAIGRTTFIYYWIASQARNDKSVCDADSPAPRDTHKMQRILRGPVVGRDRVGLTNVVSLTTLRWG
jgi:hypothetical protein